MLQVYYRYCPTERPEVRPSWFSKQLGLVSFASSLENYLASDGKDKEVAWWLGIDQHEKLSEEEKRLIEVLTKKFGIEVEYLNTNSNTRSYAYMLNKAKVATDADKLLLVEDDYLWLPEAVSEMVTAFDSIKGVDYLTPYDHPVRYDPEYYGGADLPHWENKLFLSGSRHYRTHESTCMTYMVTGKVIKEDMDLHLKYSPEDKKCPNDRELFRCLQQLGGYVDYRKRRLLIGPLPSLATHVHLPYLAPLVDWVNLAKKTNDDYHKMVNSL